MLTVQSCNGQLKTSRYDVIENWQSTHNVKHPGLFGICYCKCLATFTHCIAHTKSLVIPVGRVETVFRSEVSHYLWGKMNHYYDRTLIGIDCNDICVCAADQSGMVHTWMASLAVDDLSNAICESSEISRSALPFPPPLGPTGAA